MARWISPTVTFGTDQYGVIAFCYEDSGAHKLEDILLIRKYFILAATFAPGTAVIAANATSQAQPDRSTQMSQMLF